MRTHRQECLCHSSGVTLIELLIAVSLVSLLSVGMLMALRVGFNAMEKTNSKLLANRRVLGAQRILEQQIAGFMPVSAECMGPNGPRERVRFFQGEPQSMRFVSTYSIQEAARGYPRILEFQVIPGENNQGVRLVVNEHLYSGPLGAGRFCLGLAPDPELGLSTPRFPPIQVGPQSFVLADKLAFCRMLYREELPPPVLERWYPRWVHIKWPSAIRVEMAALEADPSKLQALSVTVPLRAQKDPLLNYAE